MKKVVRICLVVTNGCSPDPRVERHARWLAEEGHQVTIYAWDRGHELDQKSVRNGYTILRVRIGRRAASTSMNIVRQKKRFLKSLNGQFDLVIHNDSDSIETVNIHARYRILDLHDIAHAWPIMQKTNFLRRFLSSRMSKQLKNSVHLIDGFFTSSPGLAAYFEQHFSIKSTVVLNARNPHSLPRPMTKSIGYFGRIRDYEAMILFIESCKIIRFKPIIAGDGPCTKQLLEEYPQLDYRGPFNEDRLNELMSEIDVMYAMYNPEKENIRQGALPVKMFDAAAYGRPTVTSANVPMGEFCLKNKLGIVAKFGDLNSVSNAIMDAYEMNVTSVHTEEDEQAKFITLVQSTLDTK